MRVPLQLRLHYKHLGLLRFIKRRFDLDLVYEHGTSELYSTYGTSWRPLVFILELTLLVFFI